MHKAWSDDCTARGWIYPAGKDISCLKTAGLSSKEEHLQSCQAHLQVGQPLSQLQLGQVAVGMAQARPKLSCARQNSLLGLHRCAVALRGDGTESKPPLGGLHILKGGLIPPARAEVRVS